MPHQIFRRDQRPRREYQQLSHEQIATWMQYGFVKVPQAFSREQASAFTKDIWTRLGFNPHDMSTWTRDMTWMAWHEFVQVSDFAPKAWGTICDLVGGEDRIDLDVCASWGDSFIVNLGNDETARKEGNVVDEVDGWHVDGDHFVHFLDSPEQGLLVVPLWSDVIENGGGTVICTDGIEKVAKWLYAHPEGVDPDLKPIGKEKEYEDRWLCGEFTDECEHFFELTGDVGDVFILHPLMIHSAAKNGLRIPRFITNPNIVMKKAFDLNRNDPRDYNLVESKTLKALGIRRLEGWRITGERRPIVKNDKSEHEKKANDEKERLQAAKQADLYHMQLIANSSRGLVPPPLPRRIVREV